MDPTLAALTLSSRVWVICERHRIARAGRVVTVSADALTVKLPGSALPPQRYDRHTGMRIPGEGALRSNDFFIRTRLPARYEQGQQADPPYVVMNALEDPADAQA